MTQAEADRPVDSNPYDVVDYPGHAFPDTHPGRIAAVGILHGMEPAPVESCRVLELGCGDGANLVPMAYQLPRARFLGIDLAASPIARGQRLAAAVGLSNLELRVMDLQEVTAELGQFDYIIAHGVFSWVPEPVRERLLAVCAQVLAPQGIAFISYLAQPGTRIREVLRQFLLRHVGNDVPPAERVRRARFLAGLFTSELVSADPYQQILRNVAREFGELSDAGVYHDWLSPINAAMSITDFMALAGRHRLAFLGEAEYFMTCWRHDVLLAQASARLAQLEASDTIAKEQLLDDLRCRRFRQTLLCHADLPLTPAVPGRVLRLDAASRLKPTEPVRLADHSIAHFTSPHGASVRIDHPVAKAALVHLGEVWPLAVPVRVLLELARVAAGREGEPADADAEVLGGVLLACAGAVHALLTAWSPQFASTAGERPRASALARAELSFGTQVSTLRHTSISIDDPLGGALLRLLDGTRTRAELLAELARRVDAEDLEIPGSGDLPAGLDQSLAGLAEAGLLEA